jgi:hypothetical protein
MAKNNKGGITGSLLSLIFLVPKLFGFMGNLSTLVRLEAKHAYRNLIVILLLTLMTTILLTSTWLAVLALLYLYLTMHLSPIPALALVILFNIFLMIILGLVIFLMKRNMFFPATFSQISKAKFKM